MPDPKYPVYIPSKGRWGDTQALTVKMLLRDRVPFYLVVEPSEADAYRAAWPDADLLVLPEDGMRLLGARLWCREHSESAGADRHWQLDDNISGIAYRYRGRRVHCDAGVGLRAVEDFTDRYTNIGISGMNYWMFVPDDQPAPPYRINQHVYSCSLVNNRMPYTWRLLYNDDTDLCLQVLTGGLCTVLFNVFVAIKAPTMTIRGGNTDDLYLGDGRLQMARTLERQWPGVVTTVRKFGRPQHHVKDNWRQFDQPLIRRDDLDWDAIEATPANYGMKLIAVKDEVKNPTLRAWVEEHA